MASLCVTSFRRPPKCMTAGHYLQGHLNIFLGLFLLALVSPLHSLPTQQQQDKSSEAASLADQLTILEAPPSLGKLTPYDLVSWLFIRDARLTSFGLFGNDVTPFTTLTKLYSERCNVVWEDTKRR